MSIKFKKAIITIVFTLTCFQFFFFSCLIAHADLWQGITTQMAPFATDAYRRYTVTEVPPPAYTIGIILNSALSLVGIAFVIIIMYGGWNWLTAAGNEEEITKAKKWIVNGSIGLVVILASYVLSNFILSAILSAQGFSGVDDPTIWERF